MSIKKILERININPIIDVNRIPTDAKSQIELLPGLSVPLYGELLVGERDLFKQVEDVVYPYFVKINNLVKAIGQPNIDIDNLFSQLQMGVVVSPVYKEIEVDYEKLGYSALTDLAERAGVKLFMSTALLIDGEINSELTDILVNYKDIWFNNGISGSTALDMANSVLLKEPVYIFEKLETKEVDSAKLLEQTKLTWDDLYTLKGLTSDDFKALLIIYFRVGIGDFNPFEYMTQSGAANIIKQILAELPSNAIPESEAVVANLNNEKEPTKKGAKEAALK
jgi:hypothetical protein